MCTQGDPVFQLTRIIHNPKRKRGAYIKIPRSTFWHILEARRACELLESLAKLPTPIALGLGGTDFIVATGAGGDRCLAPVAAHEC